MTFRATGWLRALVFTCMVAATGCGDDGPPASPAPPLHAAMPPVTAQLCPLAQGGSHTGTHAAVTQV